MYCAFQFDSEVSCMKILGIVAEYDPFHNGHLFHIREAQKKVAPDLTYIMLSPCIKQRGELSLLSPVDRARCALTAGADAVFCLPACWTVRDAEHYALGAVSLLSGLGVTHLAFGAENADPVTLQKAADILELPSPGFDSKLNEKLSSGAGWPSAVAAALSSVFPAADGLLDGANNILAVCYLRAIRRLGVSVHPVVIHRAGGYHDALIDPDAPSAAALREALLRGSYSDAFSALPAETCRILRRRFLDGCIPDTRIMDHLLLSRLRSMTDTDLSCLPGLSEGLENALRTAVPSARSRRELIASLTGKRYPAARISRICACALLGLTKSDIEDAPLPKNALLLGLRKNPEMTSLWKQSPVPVVSSFTEWKKKAHPADLAAWRLWVQCCRLPDTLPYTETIVTI